MTIDAISSLAFISAIAAVVSAMCAYKSSSTTNKALDFQINMGLRKYEIDLIVSLLKYLKLLSILRQVPILDMPDDEFESLPLLTQDIKDKMTELKATGDKNLGEKLLKWEKEEYMNSISMETIFSNFNKDVFLALPRDPRFLRMCIKGLTKIHLDLMTNIQLSP